MIPSKFVGVLRLQGARDYLEAGMKIKKQSSSIEFWSEVGFRTVFEKYFSIAPSLHILCTANSNRALSFECMCVAR